MSRSMKKALFYLVISCPDQPGIVARVSGFIFEHGGTIVEANYHTDLEDHWFFMRYEIDADNLTLPLSDFRRKFIPIAAEFSMEYKIVDASYRKKVVVLVSTALHCLEDLLYRWRGGDMPCDIVAIVSNHPLDNQQVQCYQLPLYHIPIDKNDKQAGFVQLNDILKTHHADVIVLARYMQVLPDWLCEKYFGNIINIHHGFLPAFVGAQPYRQAYHRGVKLIGATSHYVTSELDQGPIIEQEITRISHRQRLADYRRLGKDIERTVLFTALKAHLEDRVIIHRHKTIVFTL